MRNTITGIPLGPRVCESQRVRVNFGTGRNKRRHERCGRSVGHPHGEETARRAPSLRQRHTARVGERERERERETGRTRAVTAMAPA